MRKKKNSKTTQVHQPDDHFFKEVMSRKSSVAAYLEEIHPQIADLIDLASLKISKDSFLSPDLETFTSDIIWHCKFKNSDEQLNLALLFEHKMQEHKNYSIQAGLYIFLYLHRLVNINKKPIEPILPLLFYHGKKANWQPLTVHELFKQTPGFEIIKKYIPNFEPLFLNLAGKSKKEIEQITDDFLRSALFAMFWRHNSDLFLENIVAIFELDVDEFEKHPLFVYVFSVINKPPEEIIKALKAKNFNNKNKVMSSLEQFIELGRKEGIQEGMKGGGIQKDIIGIKNMGKEKFPTDLISKILELQPTFVVDILECFADFEKAKKGNPLSDKTIKTIKKISSDGLSEALIASLFETDKQIIRAIFKK